MLKNWFALGKKPKTFEFQCACCGEIHKGSPSFSYAHPTQYGWLLEDERQKRAELSGDTCVIDGEEYYVRTILEIPISGVEEPFTWGLWVSQSKESFERYVESFNNDQSKDGSFGWLTVTIQAYDRTTQDQEFENVACDVEWQGNGARPRLIPHQSDHPLYNDFVAGISWGRAIEIAQTVMHPSG